MQRIGRGRIRGRIVQTVAGEKCDVGPALSKVSRKSDHGRPVVEEPSITYAKHCLVINAICRAQARLKIVVSILDNPSVWRNGHVRGQSASRNTRGSLAG